MKVYKPAQGKGFIWGVGLLIFSIVILAVPTVIISPTGGPGWTFTAVMGLTGILVVGMMGYFTWAAKNLEYRIKGEDLVIRGAFNQKRIPLQSIREVRKVVGTSSMKVVGASWPGFHWGTFTDPRGKGSANLYATRLWGDIILLQTKWETIGITPENPDEFLDDLNRLLPDLAQKRETMEDGEGRKRVSPWKDRFFPSMVFLSLLILAGTGIFLAMKIPGLPERVPMHYNLAGEVDRYGSPTEIWVPFGIGAVTNALLLGIGLTVARNNKMSAYMVGITSVFLSLIFCLIAVGMVLSA